MKPGISIIIPAYNEEKNIEMVIESVHNAVSKIEGNFEIIVVNDGSSDDTGRLIDKKSKSSRRVKAIHHSQNLGLGMAVKSALQKVDFSHVTFYPGDGDMAIESLTDLVRIKDQSDLVTAYITHVKKRPLFRVIISKSFVLFMNTLFKLNLRYYNGPMICKTELMKKFKLTSSGHAIFAEAKVRLISKGYHYHEIPFQHIGRIHGRSKAVTFRNIRQTFQTIRALSRDMSNSKPGL